MTDRERAVAGSMLFRGLTLDQCSLFMPLVREETYRKGEYLFHLGDEAHTLFIVRHGVIHLLMPLSVGDGEHDIVVEEAHERDTVAWSALIEPYRCTRSARAATEATLIGFRPDELQGMAIAYPDAGLKILNNLAQVIARRLHVMQTMWMRELQRNVSATLA